MVEHASNPPVEAAGQPVIPAMPENGHEGVGGIRGALEPIFEAASPLTAKITKPIKKITKTLVVGKDRTDVSPNGNHTTGREEEVIPRGELLTLPEILPLTHEKAGKMQFLQGCPHHISFDPKSPYSALNHDLIFAGSLPIAFFSKKEVRDLTRSRMYEETIDEENGEKQLKAPHLEAYLDELRDVFEFPIIDFMTMELDSFLQSDVWAAYKESDGYQEDKDRREEAEKERKEYEAKLKAKEAERRRQLENSQG